MAGQMATETPPFWYEKPGLQSTLMAPVSWIYSWVSGRHMKNAKREKIDIPIICIGNFTVGGTGKTPTAITIAKSVIDMGLKPGFLTRGYGGTASEPTVVELGQHSARYVGDEPLLLAKIATTIVASDRVAGAKKLRDQGVDIILMDDGFQSAHLWFDLSVMVLDANRGLGNGRVIPAGPVRAPLKQQMQYADMLLVIGTGTAADNLIRIAARSAKPVYNALLKPTAPQDFNDVRCLAFAAIGDPDKFYTSLKNAGAHVKETKSFPDHHYYKDDEIAELIALSNASDLTLVTTAKDMVRLDSEVGKPQELIEKTQVFEIQTAFDDPATGRVIVERAMANYKNRILNKT